MKLITKEIQTKLDKAGWRGEKAIFKLFNCTGGQTWVVFGQDEEEPDILNAACDLGMGCVEFGSISLSEIKAVLGWRLNRDMYFGNEGKDLKFFLEQETLSGI